MPVLGSGGFAIGLGGGRFLVLSTTALGTGTVDPGPATPSAITPARTLAPLDITVRAMVVNARNGVPWEYVESFGPGQMPASRYAYGTLDDGTVVPVQMSAVSSWPNGDTRKCKFSFTIPGNRAEGEKVNIRIRTAPGTRVQTPCLTLDGMKARSDFRIRCYGLDLGDEEYELRLNDLIGTAPAFPYGVNPVRGLDVYGQGAEAFDGMGWSMLRRVGDGAIHRTLKGALFFTYRKGGDGFSLLPQIFQDNTYDAHPAGTAGPLKPERIAFYVDLFDGATRLYSWGGPNDWRATSVPASAFSATTGHLTYPAGAALGFSWNKGVPFAFAARAGGSLPAGIDPTEPYWPTYYGKNLAANQTEGPLYRFRGPASASSDLPRPPAWMPNTAYGAGTTIKGASGVDYRCMTAGTSGTAIPAGAGDAIADGTCVWRSLSADLSTAGFGTIDMFPAVCLFTGTSALCLTREAGRVWRGAGATPAVQIGLDFAHSFRDTRLLPPVDYAQGVSARAGTPRNYEMHNVYADVIWNIEAVGDAPSRIGPMPWASMWMLLGWDDPVAHREGLCFAGAWGDFQTHYRDERSGCNAISTRGPKKDGVTYPGHAPCNPTLWYSNKIPMTYGNPKFAVGWPSWATAHGAERDNSGYAYQYNDMGGAAHHPNYWLAPYILTGDAAFLRMGESNLGLLMSQTGWRGGALSINSGTATAEAYDTAIIGQPRGVAWTLRELSNFEMVAPDDHPYRPVVADMLRENVKFYEQNALRAYASNIGWVNWTPNKTYDVGGRPYHNSMMYYVMSLMHWRYQDTALGPMLETVLDVSDRQMIDMYDETKYPGALYFHSEYGSGGLQGTASTPQDLKNVLGRGAGQYVQSHEEYWNINWGPRPSAPVTGTGRINYKSTSLNNVDTGGLPVQWCIAAGALGMRGVKQPRARPLVDAINARMGKTKLPLESQFGPFMHWSVLPLDL